MRWINVNIDLLYKTVSIDGFKPSVVMILQYPIFEIVARTVELKSQEEIEFEKIILNYLSILGKCNIDEMSSLIGVNKRFLRIVIDQLIISENITKITQDTYGISEKGLELLNIESPKIYTEYSRKFLIDGLTHKPLDNDYYEQKKMNYAHTFIDHFNSEIDNDYSYREKSDFRPDIVHVPPTDEIMINISSVPGENRRSYNIPLGLIEVKEFSYELLTHPVCIVCAFNNEKIKKELYDLCLFAPISLENNNFMDQYKDRIQNLYVEYISDRKMLANSWSNNFSENYEDVIISSASVDRVKNLIVEYKDFKRYNIKPENVSVTQQYISLIIKEENFEIRSHTSSILDSLIRGYTYIYQHSSTGIWIIYIQVSPGDEFTKKLLNVKKSIDDGEEEFVKKNLIETPKEIRKILFVIKALNIIEEIDEESFIGKVKSNKYRLSLKRNNL